MGFGYLNGAEALGHQNRNEKALEYTEKGKEIFIKLGSRYPMAGVYSLYGLIYRNQGKYDEAIESVDKCIALYEELKMPFYAADGFFNKSKIEYQREDFEKAEEYAEKARDIWLDLNADKKVKEVDKFLEKVSWKISGERPSRDVSFLRIGDDDEDDWD